MIKLLIPLLLIILYFGFNKLNQSEMDVFYETIKEIKKEVNIVDGVSRKDYYEFKIPKGSKSVHVYHEYFKNRQYQSVIKDENTIAFVYPSHEKIWKQRNLGRNYIDLKEKAVILLTALVLFYLLLRIN